MIYSVDARPVVKTVQNADSTSISERYVNVHVASLAPGYYPLVKNVNESDYISVGNVYKSSVYNIHAFYFYHRCMKQLSIECIDFWVACIFYLFVHNPSI